MLCACIKNDIVKGIIQFDSEAEYHDMEHEFDLMLDCANYTIVPQIGWQYIPETNQFNYGQLASKPSIKITKLSLRNRFTIAELSAIISLSRQSTPYGLMIQKTLDDQRDATFIDLARADTISGINGLVALGLITQERANLILQTPPSYEEAYKG